MFQNIISFTPKSPGYKILFMERPPLDEYPRPLMQRESWINLNGYWDFSVSKDGKEDYKTKILVPFPPESMNSGIERITCPDEVIWYRRPVHMKVEPEHRLIIHFTAVDHACDVFINERRVAHHEGGYLPFSVDITDYFSKDDFMLRVRVTDPSDTGGQPRGKQRLNPSRIWYTPFSGIWQSVWMEQVPNDHIENLLIRPDYDKAGVEITVKTSRMESEDAEILLEGRKIKIRTNFKNFLRIQEKRPWTPDDPYLYRFSIKYKEDEVGSYFGLRKFSIEKGEDGIKRLALNNKAIFHHGILDQGYWKYGLSTPSSDDEMINDILKMKEMGFNTIRKHVKIECPRWYYHADRLGMLVWQDIPNGGGKYNDFTVTLPLFSKSFLSDRKHRRLFSRRDKKERDGFVFFTLDVVAHLYSQTSICMWVLFNEGWGQFDSADLKARVEAFDDSRTIDHASGWHDQGIGDFSSRHVYFFPFRMKKDERCVILSEFGGYGLDGEKISERRKFTYKDSKDNSELEKNLQKLYRRDVIRNIPKGLTASIYTQLSDVEQEKNGLLSYDRKTVKVEKEAMLEIRKEIDQTLNLKNIISPS